MAIKPLLTLACIAAAGVLASTSSAAHAYPDQTIRLIVPYTPGGVTDALARAVAESLSQRLNQPIVVANQPGGGANIGANMVAKADPDGYTLLMGSAATHAINASLYKNMPFDHIKDFQPISLVAEVQNILVVNPSVPVKTVSELIAYAKERPGELNFGSSGKGGTIHLSGELFKSMANVDMVHIPYKGSAPAVVDLMSGQTQVMFDSSVAPYVKAGKLRALATTGTTRSTVLPGIPTMAEAGLPGYEATAWFGIFAPAGTPRPVVEKLNRELRAVLKEPKMRTWMSQQGAEAAGNTPEEFAAYIQKETKKWARVTKQAGIQPE